MNLLIKNYLKSLIKEVLDEGLIKTYNIDSTLNHMENWGKLEDHIHFSKDKNTIKMSFRYADWSQLEYSLNHLNTYGWFPSKIFLYKDDKNKKSFVYSEKLIQSLIDSEYELIEIIFESKYDIEIFWDDLPETLYHISPKIYFDKIKKLGLVPKMKQKSSIHTNRIYLSINKESLKMIKQKLSLFSGHLEYFIIPIQKKFLKRLKFYQDPNATEFGVYTHSNIPIEYLDFENVIFLN